MKQFVFFLFALAFFLVAVPVLSAQAPCTPIYGGGLNADGDPYCLEQVQAKEGSTPPKTPTSYTTPLSQLGQSGTTKGGTIVQPAPNVQKQPNTGPEMLGLLSLIPAGLLGWKLRKQA